MKRSGALGLADHLSTHLFTDLLTYLLAGGNVAIDFGADADFGHDGFMPHI
jgi:hypothetical protein